MTGTSSARSSELAQLLDDGRAAYLAIDDEHDGAPIAGSPIHADWATLSNLNGEPWPLWLRHFASVSARLLASAAAEYMAGLATLYRGSAQPLTLAHFPVTRAVVESLGQSYWILRPGINAKAQTGDQFARARAARAYLTLCASEFQRVSVEEERSGEGSPAHQSAKSRLEELKNDASKYFESVQLGTRTNQWKIEEQSRPTFTGFSKDLMHLAFQERRWPDQEPLRSLVGHQPREPLRDCRAHGTGRR
jgi:hypothetical protein